MTAEVLLVAGAGICTLLAGRLFGWRLAAFAATLGALALAPVRLWQEAAPVHPGVAGLTPAVYTFTVVLLVLLPAWSLGRGGRPLGRLVLVFMALLWLGIAFVWDGSREQWTGVLHYTGAAAAWFVGVALARGFDRDGRDGRFAVWISLGIVGVNTLASLVQLVRPSSEALLTEQGGVRTSGLMNHPADLGKILILLMALTLPLTRSLDPRTRRLAVVSVAGSAALTGLTVSRANFLGVFVMVMIWAVIGRAGVPSARQLAMPAVLFLVSLPFVGAMLDRQQADPGGGSRPALLEAGLFQISQAPWTGTGPNAYISVVGAYHERTAAGLPVHNSFLLAAAELGVPLAVALFLPVIGGIVVAWRRKGAPGAVGDYAIALLALTPALLVVGMTGWGLMKAPILPLLFVVVAFLVTQICDGAPADGEDAEAAVPTARRDRNALPGGRRGAIRTSALPTPLPR